MAKCRNGANEIALMHEAEWAPIVWQMVDICGYIKVRFGWMKLQSSENAGESTLSDV